MSRQSSCDFEGKFDLLSLGPVPGDGQRANESFFRNAPGLGGNRAPQGGGQPPRKLRRDFEQKIVFETALGQRGRASVVVNLRQPVKPVANGIFFLSTQTFLPMVCHLFFERSHPQHISSRLLRLSKHQKGCGVSFEKLLPRTLEKKLT